MLPAGPMQASLPEVKALEHIQYELWRELHGKLTASIVEEFKFCIPMPSIASSMIAAARLRVNAVQTTTPTRTAIDSGEAQMKFNLWQPVAVENFCPISE
jgi:hypothetical protein